MTKILVIDKTIQDRFDDKYIPEPNSGCWLWVGSLDKRGYGQIRFHGKTSQAHRISFRLHKTEIPSGMCVLHLCDNPSCVNPDHLFLGTQKDNMVDKKAKGRGVKGENCNFSKVTSEIVKIIREKYKSGESTQKQLGIKYGLSQAGVWHIVHGVNWRHL